MSLQEIRTVARSYFEDGLSPSHDWHHVERVESLADELAGGYPDCDERVLHLSVLLHDIGRWKEDAGEIEDHAAWGAAESARILDEFGVDDETIRAVSHCIRAHRYSNDVEPETLEAELLSDADNLDALGAIGIARCLNYGAELGSPIYDPEIPPEEDSSRAGETQFNHFFKKILDLPDRMYTEAGAELADERAQFVRTFVDRLEREARGEC